MRLTQMVNPRLLILLNPTHYSHRQPAIDYLSMRLMRRFNASANGSKTNVSKTKATKKNKKNKEEEKKKKKKKKNTVLLYNTYQLYLDDGRGRLEAHLQVAKEEGFALGVKAVRGAYIQSEAEYAACVGGTSPVLSSKEHTDTAYDTAVEAVLDRIVECSDEPPREQTGETEIDASSSPSSSPQSSSSSSSSSSPSSPSPSAPPSSFSSWACSPSVVVATHNAASVTRTVHYMDKHGLARDDPRIHLAQIMGMSDGLTLALGHGGFNVHKLVLFGTFGEVMPWMLRRLDENADLLGATAAQRTLLWSELRRRARGGVL